MADQPALLVQGLYKRYRSRTAVDHIDLRVDPGTCEAAIMCNPR